jgi:uncharacterized membrane protein
VAAFDRLRGLIIVLMAVDHASYFIARVHPNENWAVAPPYYADTLAFLTRWVTHLCAPGFFMLMGIGIAYFARDRVPAGWTPARITRFLAARGAVLLVVQHLLENPAWLLGTFTMDPAAGARIAAPPGPGGELMIGLAVLSALGVAMIAGSVLWRAPWWLLVAVAVTAVLTSDALTPMPSAALDPQPVWRQLLFVPGHTGLLQNLYPWVIWLFPMVCGVSMGHTFHRDAASVSRLCARLGTLMLVLFVAARAWGGDPHPPGGGLIGWLTVTKYPPSAAFFAVTLGLNLIILAALVKWPARSLAPLEVYGRTPFFFYLVHLWAFGALSWLFPTGTSLPAMYVVWAVVMAGLYPVCARYARFKFSKPTTSLWRLF